MALISSVENPVGVYFVVSFSMSYERLDGKAFFRSDSTEGSVPSKIFWFEGEVALASSARADRLDGGKVFTKSGVDTFDGEGSLVSPRMELFLPGEKERGGVEAPEARRRWIWNLLKRVSR
jgi:hypothetical protein